MTDLVANTFVRITPQTMEANELGNFSASQGTSVVRSPSYRDASGTLRMFPGEGLGMGEPLNPHLEANIVTDDMGQRYESVITGEFMSNGMVDANITINTTFPDPPVGKTTIAVSSHIDFLRDVPLSTGEVFVQSVIENDRLRLVTFSSSFIGSLPVPFELPDGTVLPNGGTSFDADLIRFEDANKDVQTLMLNDSAKGAILEGKKEAYLFDAPVALGDWVELVKTEDDTKNPTSPSVRIDILNKDDLLLIGLQGRLTDSDRTPETPEVELDPNQDSLQVWFEVLGTPNIIPKDTSFALDYTISAVPEPTSVAVWSVLGGLVISGTWRRRRASPRTMQLTLPGASRSKLGNCSARSDSIRIQCQPVPEEVQ